MKSSLQYLMIIKRKILNKTNMMMKTIKMSNYKTFIQTMKRDNISKILSSN